MFYYNFFCFIDGGMPAIIAIHISRKKPAKDFIRAQRSLRRIIFLIVSDSFTDAKIPS